MAQRSRGKKRRAGLPAPASIVSQQVLVPARAAPRGAAALRAATSYRILRTNEVDPKDRPIPRAAVTPLGAPAVPVSDDFGGTARKAAKLAIATANTEHFDDLQDLLPTLASKTAMNKHKPKITIEANSGRVAEEKRNIRLRAFLYAASREDDNDFHLIIGRDVTKTPHLYMTVEISGLPPNSFKSFTKLKAARDAFKAFFKEHVPGPTYDFYDPPVPIEVEGSLFFDMSHVGGQGPGPKSLHKDIPTIWEIHPVTRIVFEP
jgi:hypothetical protein